MSQKGNYTKMEYISIEKPDLNKVDRSKIFKQYVNDIEKYHPYIKRANEPKYLYWDKIKYKPTPPNLTNTEFWWLIKQVRKLSARPTVIRTENKNKFVWVKLDCTDELLHKIDMHTGGQIFSPNEVLSKQNKQRFITRGILEEAIASSQLEGANTTRKQARKLILEKRTPKNKSELMIINNYKTMQLLE